MTLKDLKESLKGKHSVFNISDKEEETQILKSRCDILSAHVKESESMNKHLKTELEHYQQICEDNWNSIDKRNNICLLYREKGEE